MCKKRMKIGVMKTKKGHGNVAYVPNNVKITSIEGRIAGTDLIAIKKYVAVAYALNQDVFSGISPSFKVILCYSRKAFDKESERRTEKW